MSSCNNTRSKSLPSQHIRNKGQLLHRVVSKRTPSINNISLIHKTSDTNRCIQTYQPPQGEGKWVLSTNGLPDILFFDF
jgi:hypothetical protein